MPEIRPATAEDMPAVAELWHEGWHDGHAGHVPEGLTAARTLHAFHERTPSRVAETVLKAIEKGRSEVTVPWFPYRPASVLQALAPGLVGRFAGMTGHRPGSV